MEALEKNFQGYALYANVLNNDQYVSGEELLEAIECVCGNGNGGIRIETACPPHDYFLIFSSDVYCTRVLDLSNVVRCGNDSVTFSRWNHGPRATSGELSYE